MKNLNKNTPCFGKNNQHSWNVEFEKLFKKLLELDINSLKDDYFQDGIYDLEGLKSDLNILRRNRIQRIKKMKLITYHYI